MLEDSTNENPEPENPNYRPEAYTIAQSMILGLVIASVAIGIGPLYGAIVALGGAAATLIAGVTLSDEFDQPLLRIHLPSQKTIGRIRAIRRSRLIGSSLDEAGR